MTESVTRLKDLLFDGADDSAGLSKFERRFQDATERLRLLEALSAEEKGERLEILRKLEQLFTRAGTEERFLKSVAAVLDEALREAEVARHDQLSRALAPLVVNTIKSELKNSQDEMVEVLYPLTGRMVKAYVATAIKDLTDQINRRLEQNPISLRFRSLVSGTPVSDLAILESQRLKVDEVFLIRRGSGVPLAHWPASGQPLSNSDIHLSGVLSAINDFASHAFAEDGGSLRAFRFDDFQVYLRASPVYLVAAKCRGVAPRGTEAIFDDGFLSLLEDLHKLPVDEEPGDDTGAGHKEELAPLVDRLETKTTAIYERNEKAGLWVNPLRALVFLVAVPLFAWLIWKGYTSLEEHQVLTAARGVAADLPDLEGYRPGLEVGYRGRTLRVTGLTPNIHVRKAFLNSLREQLPATEIQSQLGVLPSVDVVDPTPRITELRQQISGLESTISNLKSTVSRAEAEASRLQIARSLDASARRLTLSLPELESLGRLVGDEAGRVRVREATVAVRRVAREIGAHRAALERADADPTLVRRLGEPLGALARRLREASAGVSSLLTPDGRTSVPPAGPQPKQDARQAAGAIAVESEKFSAVALSVSKAMAQAKLIKIPPPPAPVVLPREPTAQEKLAAFVQTHAVFFGNGTAFVDPAQASRTLDQLAERMRGTTGLLRVFGYTDDTGGIERNGLLAQERAAKVAGELVSRGVPESRIVAVGRADRLNLSSLTGTTSPNRRVEFALGFAGETKPAAKQ